MTILAMTRLTLVLLTSVAGLNVAQAKEVLTRIAFGSCAQQWSPQPIWNDIAARKPDLFLFLGDAIYGDWDGERVFIPTSETLKRDWAQLANRPEFSKFRSKVPMLATWDNHDYGKHDGGAEFSLKEVSKKLFLDFFGEPAGSVRWRRTGIYDAKVFGPFGRRTQIILLDTRTFESPYIKDGRSSEEKKALNIRGQYLPNSNPATTLLGEAQWRWLEGELKKPAELRLVASSTQIVADEKGMEEWGNFPHERQRFFNLIEATKANGVIILSGNVHFSEISGTKEGPYPIYDFTSSGITHANPAYGRLKNTKRMRGPYTEENYGIIEIDWDNKSGPLVVMRAFGMGNVEAFGAKIPLGSLSVN